MFLSCHVHVRVQLQSLHHEYGFISESFGLNWYIFVAFTNIKTQVSIIMKIQINDLNLKKLAEYLNSTVIVVSSNPVVGPSPQTNISFFLIITMHWWTIVYSKNNNIFIPIKTQT